MSPTDPLGTRGHFVLRLAVHAGQPGVRATWRVIHDEATGTRSVTRLDLVAGLPSAPQTSHWTAAAGTDGDVTLRHPRVDHFEVIDAGGDPVDSGSSAPGWLAGVTADHAWMVLVRHFREQFPKALAVTGDELRIELFSPTPEEPAYRPTEGEAKRHEVWLAVWDRAVPVAELADRAAAWARPPRLFDAAAVAASGGLGHAAPLAGPALADYREVFEAQYGDLSPSSFYANGIRDFGDLLYDRDKDYWRNGYYDVQQGLASAYLMSGDARWFDHLEAVVRHIIDIDVCHASTEHPDWVGSIHGYNGADHTAASPWAPTQRTWGTLAYWRLTGDRDARDAALGVAESALRSRRGLGNRSVRNHAGILTCLTAAYDETGDLRYLEGARQVVHDALRRIEPRRGTYVEMHGSVSYRGNVPWMVAQLTEPLYHYYRQSGDVAAATALVGLIESVLTENTTPGVWGDVHGYSHNPQYAKNAVYHALIAPAVFYAYELTGDDGFLRHGRAMYRQMIAEKRIESVMNCAWNTPALLYYLSRYGRE